MLNPYPTRFKISKLNKEYEFIDLSIPEGFNYMILESLDYIYKKKIIKSIHVVYLKDILEEMVQMILLMKI